MTKDIVPELHRPVAYDSVSEKQAAPHIITAEPDECAALATRFDLIEIKDLEADIKMVRPRGEELVEVHGHFSASVTQKCVVTLDPVQSNIEGDIEGYFTDVETPSSIVQEVEMPSDREAPEYIADNKIDLGELIAQHIALELDPYPRSEAALNAETDAHKAGKIKDETDISHDHSGQDHANAEAGQKGKNPFAVLAGLKTQKSGDDST